MVVTRRAHGLTTAEGWDAWFTHGATIDRRVGGALRLRWKDAEGVRHRVTLWGSVHVDVETGGPIVALEPNARFAFQWTSADHPTTVEVHLEPRGEGTVVTVTETGYEERDLEATGVAGEIGHRSPFAMCASGWGEALTLLKFYLEHGVTYGPVPR